jgi:hypothetical protein
VWKRTAKGRELHFYLAGINNQNFLMRDRETKSWWQQVTGRAISGPLAGATLELVPNDELTLGVWKAESPNGLVLARIATHEKDYEEGWEKEVAKYPVPVSFPGQGLADRDVILGISMEGQSRAFPLDRVRGPNPVQDHMNGIPIVLVTGPDGQSVRIFRAQWNGTNVELYRDAEQPEGASQRLIDSQGNTWNFSGCATSGPAQGQCLEKINYLKDYWFDWKNYNPQTTVYNH